MTIKGYNKFGDKLNKKLEYNRNNKNYECYLIDD